MAVFIVGVGLVMGTFFIASGYNQNPKSTNKILGGVIMIFAFFISIFAFPSRDNPSGDSSLMGISIIMIVLGGMISIFSSIKKYLENKKKAKEQEVENKTTKIENAKVREYDENCVKVYEIYLKDNYDIKNEEVNRIISKSHNIPIEEIKSMYERGKEVAIIRENEKKLAEIMSKREKEDAVFRNEMQMSILSGKDKYLDFLNKKLEGYKAVQFTYNLLSDAYVSGAVQARNPQQTDPYFYAGIANGIGGPASAMMTASEIAAKNEKAKRDGEIIAQNSLNEAVKMSIEAQKSNDIISNLENMINSVNNSLIDDDTEKNFDKMKIIKTSYKILETKNIEVTINYELDTINILNKAGILDGSLYISVFNSKQEKIADGYYNTPNMDIEEDKYVIYSDIGFKSKGSLQTVCVSENYKEIDSNETYTIKVEPVNLWVMEKIN